MELSRFMKKTPVILHSDLNCFYASVEMMLNPQLKGKPVAVCGNTENRHGIVLAKSELAKKCGVKTAMVNWEAKRLCPDLIMVEPNFDQYIKYSKLAREIYYRYTDLVEPFGMDECWLDVTDSQMLFGSGFDIAQKIRHEMKTELGLTVSVGVSFNKVFAKLGSDMKKPDAVTEIKIDDFKNKVWPLHVSELLYVGKSTVKKLEFYGVHTIGQLAATDPELLTNWFGVKGEQLWHFANGTDTSKVMHKDYKSEVKSIGHGITCKTDLTTEKEVWLVMLELSQDIGHKLKTHNLSAKSVQITIKNNDLTSKQYQCKLPFPTQSAHIIACTGRKLFNDNLPPKINIRAVTVRAIDLCCADEAFQVNIFNDINQIEKIEKLDNAVENIRQRFGKKAVYSAALLENTKMVTDRTNELTLPGQMHK